MKNDLFVLVAITSHGIINYWYCNFVLNYNSNNLCFSILLYYFHQIV